MKDLIKHLNEFLRIGIDDSPEPFEGDTLMMVEITQVDPGFDKIYFNIMRDVQIDDVYLSGTVLFNKVNFLDDDTTETYKNTLGKLYIIYSDSETIIAASDNSFYIFVNSYKKENFTNLVNLVNDGNWIKLREILIPFGLKKTNRAFDTLSGDLFLCKVQYNCKKYLMEELRKI